MFANTTNVVNLSTPSKLNVNRFENGELRKEKQFISKIKVGAN
jgi:hypothetical protein